MLLSPFTKLIFLFQGTQPPMVWRRDQREPIQRVDSSHYTFQKIRQTMAARRSYGGGGRRPRNAPRPSGNKIERRWVIYYVMRIITYCQVWEYKGGQEWNLWKVKKFWPSHVSFWVVTYVDQWHILRVTGHFKCSYKCSGFSSLCHHFVFNMNGAPLYKSCDTCPTNLSGWKMEFPVTLI